MRLPLLFAAALLLTSGASAQRQARFDPCQPPFGRPANCIGSWSDPVRMWVSCTQDVVPCASSTDPTCCDGCFTDEVTHAALIPEGEMNIDGQMVSIQGRVLVWTICDFNGARTVFPYRSHLWDPENPAAAPIARPQVLERINPRGVRTNPFCSGHAWILDDTPAKDPKLLVAGGTLRTAPPTGSSKVYWFDPTEPDPDLAWNDEAVRDLQNFELLWYPSVATYMPDLSLEPPGTQRRFDPLIVGGSVTFGPSCNPAFSFDRWWTLAPPYAEPVIPTGWNPGLSHGYLWNQYPRTILLSSNLMQIVGNVITCEAELDPNAAEYGRVDDKLDPNDQSPVRVIDPVSGALHLGTDPNEVGFDVGGLHYSNAVIFHTLIHPLAFDPQDPLSNYRLDRILVSGGARDGLSDGVPLPTDPTFEELAIAQLMEAQPRCLEYRPNDVDPTIGTWTEKASPQYARYFGSFVPMPDGRILATGGQSIGTIAGGSDDGDLDIHYFGQAEIFDPGRDTNDPGRWIPVASRKRVVSDPDTGTESATPRGYHSLALLLPDGTVGLMGGREISETMPFDDYREGTATEDTVEIYTPPYAQNPSRRPTITAAPDQVRYGVPFDIQVGPGEDIHYAVIIGAGSVTHNFDYNGLRYVELMTRQSGTTVTVVPPPHPELEAPGMAPEGHYLLFVVTRAPSLANPRRREVIPSKGEFVKLTF